MRNPSHQVEALTFTFQRGVTAERYDSWDFFTTQWPERQGKKAVDLVAVDRASTCWLIEAKDYRVITAPPRRSNLQGLPTTLSVKVRDSLAGLAAAAGSATKRSEQQFAKRAIQAQRTRRVVLHLEPHPPQGPHRKLFPRQMMSVMMQDARRRIRDIDPHALILSISTTDARFPWTVA